MEIKKEEKLEKRPPVVVFLGHVDHGKSSLLESIKELNIKITARESGGITQHIGAYQIERKGEKITFIDTPGHEAFSQMRSRGAKIADIAILVIAADEGIKPQTKEAISHIKEAKIPMIVAINKIDKPGANPENIKSALQKEGLLVEDYGGEIPVVKTSAKTGEGVEELLDLITLLAEMQKLGAEREKPAQGVVVESYLDPKRGPAATIIVSEGTLRQGDIIATHSTLGKVRILEDFRGKKIEKVLPSQPALVIGFNKAPVIGEKFFVFPDLEKAESWRKERKGKRLERKKEREEKKGEKVVNLVIKTDVLGSIEAIEEIINNLSQEKIALSILKSGVGEINENDVKLAASGNALVLGFRVKTNPIAKRLAQKEKVRIFNFNVIYDLITGVRKFMERKLEPEIIRKDLGKMKVLVVFWTKKKRQIIGGRIIEGEVPRGARIEILREGEKKGEGKIIELQRNKKAIELAKKGEEIGILYEGEGRIEKGDILLIYKKERGKVEL